MKKHTAITLFCLLLSMMLQAQIPTKVFEIESILVDGCAGSDEGRNEMVIFMTGPNPVNINHIRVDGAGSSGVIQINKWPNNNFLGWAGPGDSANKINFINSTIINCGRLIEPLSGFIPAGKKCLIITSAAFNPTAHDFSTLGDTLYVLLQNVGNTSGHFRNYDPAASTRTLVLTHTGGLGADTVSYNVSLLQTQSGGVGAQDGAGVRYAWNGNPTYYNDGCQAPYTPVSAAWNSPGIVCNNASPFDLSNYITGTYGGIWTGIGVSGNIFNPAGLNDTVNISYIAGYYPCADTVTHPIIVVPAGTASWTPPGSICSSAPALNLNNLVNGTPGGIWSGSGVSGNTFNPSGLSGNISITYSVGTPPCNDSLTQSVQVIPQASAAWNSPGTICQNDPPISLNSLITGTPGGTWSGSGVSGFTFNPSGLNGTISITYIAGTGGCNDTVTQNIVVTTQSNTSWNGPDSLCSNAPAVNLSAYLTGDPGGSWSGTGITDPASGLFNPSMAGTGTHIITYTITGSCGSSHSDTIIVTASADAQINSSGPYCVSETAVTLSSVTPGGTWWGNGISDSILGIFNPQLAGVGSHTVFYGINGECGDTSSAVIQVIANAIAQINPVAPVCENENAIQLSSINPGGTWAGNGISDPLNGSFNPSIAGEGIHQIIYTIAGPCGDTDTINITVYSAPDVQINFSSESCAGQNDASAWIIISNGTQPFNILWNNNETNDMIINLAPGLQTVTVTDANNCSITKQVNILASTEPCFTPHVWLPNCFSPNDDNHNDIFFIRGQGIESVEMAIYDRWGEKVFETSSLNIGWDGTFRGKKVSSGVFVYYLKASLSDNTQVIKKGNITLVY